MRAKKGKIIFELDGDEPTLRYGDLEWMGVGFFINSEQGKLTRDDFDLIDIKKKSGKISRLALEYERENISAELMVDIFDDDTIRIDLSSNVDSFSSYRTGGISLNPPPHEGGFCSHNDLDISLLLSTLLSHSDMDSEELLKSIGHYFELFKSGWAIKLGWDAFKLSRSELDWNPFAYPRHFEDLSQVPRYVLYLLLKLEGGGYLCATPGFGEKQKTYLKGGDKIRSEGIGGIMKKSYGRIPGAFFSFDENPYEATRSLYGKFSKDRGPLNETLQKLGWCTWNAFYEEVSQEKVSRNLEILSERKLPIKFIIIDDGWQDIERKVLKSYEPNSKFPDMPGLVRKAKEECGVENVGLWHAMQGDWDGVGDEEDFGDNTVKSMSRNRIPDPDGSTFFDEWYSRMSEWGIDFVKVDNQHDFTRHILDRYSIGESYENLLSDVYEAAGERLKTVLNCMSMVPECLYREKTNVVRSSFDYIPHSKENAKMHMIFNAYNSFWLSCFTNPDWDMFETHDPNARLHALARLMSGGPVYVTGDLKRCDEDLLRKIAFEDGRIPRPDEPAMPAEDCLLRDPYREKIPLKLISKQGESVLVAAFNVDGDGENVKCRIKGEDFIGSDECVIYEYFSEKVHKGTIETVLGELECELFVLVPIEARAAVIGLVDVMNPPAGVEDVKRTNDSIEVKLRQPGKFKCYLEAEEVRVNSDGGKLEEAKELPENSYNYERNVLTVMTSGRELEIKFR